MRVTYRLSPASFSSKHAAALARLLQSPPEIQGTVLAAIATIAAEKPVRKLLHHATIQWLLTKCQLQTYFAQHLQYFYIYQLFDDQANKLLKLQILVLLANESNINTILNEFTTYTKVLDSTFRRQVVSSIGDCAEKVSKVQSSCLNTLMDLLDAYREGEQHSQLLGISCTTSDNGHIKTK